MASNIDPSKPTTSMAYTADVRANFATAADEITALQAAMDSATVEFIAGGFQSTGGEIKLGIAPWMWTLGADDTGAAVLRDPTSIPQLSFNPTGAPDGTGGVLFGWPMVTPNIVGGMNVAGDMFLTGKINSAGNSASDNSAAGGTFRLFDANLNSGGMVQIQGGNAPVGTGGYLALMGGFANGAGNFGGNVYIAPGWSNDGAATGGSVVIDLPANYSPTGPQVPANLLVLIGLPTTDPGYAGAVWVDETADYALKISQG